MSGYNGVMEKLSGLNKKAAQKWLGEAAKEATQATCHQAKCGCVIVQDGKLVGRGYNSPPNHDETQRMCGVGFDKSKKPKSDTTCCMHAEWRAIIDAFKTHASELDGSTLYFVRVDEQGNQLHSGKPYCTVCSRLALDAGIAQFVLSHEDGIVSYATSEYNQLSYKYHQANS